MTVYWKLSDENRLRLTEAAEDLVNSLAIIHSILTIARRYLNTLPTAEQTPPSDPRWITRVDLEGFVHTLESTYRQIRDAFNDLKECIEDYDVSREGHQNEHIAHRGTE